MFICVGRIVSHTSQRVQSTFSSWLSSTQSAMMAWWDSTSDRAGNEEEDEPEEGSDLGKGQDPIQQPPKPSSPS